MRVKILTTANFPHGQAATSRVKSYALALQGEGCQVEIISTQNAKPLPGRVLLSRGICDGIAYEVLLTKEQQMPKIIRYLWAYLGPALLIWSSIRTLRSTDVYLLYMSTIWSRLALVLIFRVFRKNFAVEVNEFPSSAEGSRLTRLPMVRSFNQFMILRVIFPLVPKFIVISQALERLAGNYASTTRTLRLPIFYKELPFSEPQSDKVRRAPYLFHAGSLSDQKDGIVAVFEAFVAAHKQLWLNCGVRLRFLLTNKQTLPVTWRRIERILSDANLTDFVEITGHCTDKQLANYLEGALALVINKPVNLQNNHNFPTKLGEYLASGRPVIFGGECNEANSYLHHRQNSFVLKPNDVSGMACTMMRTWQTMWEKMEC